MDEYSITHCDTEYPEPEPKSGTGAAWTDAALTDVRLAVVNLKTAINQRGPLNVMQQRELHEAIKDLEHMTRGRWVA